MKPKPGRREQWHRRISDQERTGESIRTYCREHGVSESSFYSWRKRLRSEQTAMTEPPPTGPALKPEPQPSDAATTHPTPGLTAPQSSPTHPGTTQKDPPSPTRTSPQNYAESPSSCLRGRYPQITSCGGPRRC